MPEAPAGGTQNNTSGTDLTAAERAAVDAATEACAALGQADNTARNATSSGAESATAPVPNGLTFGTCPVVAANLSGSPGDATFSMNVDFGTGCTLVEGYTWSGSASGSLRQATKTVDLTFNNITCNTDTLTGTCAVAYSVGVTSIELTGTWSLGWVSGDDSVITSGTGTCAYNAASSTATVSTFTGQIVGTATYSAELGGIVISYVNNLNVIPSAGTATLSGPDIRGLVVRFNENSPSTGDVEVSINGSPFVTVNLFAL